MKKVIVLMSTYNGERYLEVQIRSVLAQVGVDVSVLVRDDGSSDGTIEILKKFKEEDQRLDYYQGGNLKPKLSFFDLVMQAGKSDYYAFCDQDDVWDSDKLLSAVNKMEDVDKNKAIVYCSNLRVVDQDLCFCRNSHKKPLTQARYSFLIDYGAVGCTQVFNNKARELLCKNITDDCLMHDSWLYILCSLAGYTIYDPIPHISYRQHQHNVVGTNTSRISQLKKSISRMFEQSIQPRYITANAIMRNFSGVLNDEDERVITKIATYKDSLINRIKLLFDFRIGSSSVWGDFKYRFLIILGRI